MPLNPVKSTHVGDWLHFNSPFGGEDQYWEYMREETRTSAEIEKYFADKENEYKEQLGSDGETAQTWDEAREELVDQLIAEQDVKTV